MEQSKMPLLVTFVIAAISFTVTYLELVLLDLGQGASQFVKRLVSSIKQFVIIINSNSYSQYRFQTNDWPNNICEEGFGVVPCDGRKTSRTHGF